MPKTIIPIVLTLLLDCLSHYVGVLEASSVIIYKPHLLEVYLILVSL